MLEPWWDAYREDPEFIASLPLSRATWVVSTVRDRAINRMILHGLKEQGYKGKVAISAAGSYDARFFEQAGVDMVLVPYTDAAREAATQLFPQKKADNPQA